MVNGVLKVNESNGGEFLDKLDKLGEQGFFDFIIDGWKTLINNDENEQDGSELDLQMLEFSDSFFSLFRRTGERKYFTIGKIFRRVAHIIYRHNLKKFDKKPNFGKFLNLIVTNDD